METTKLTLTPTTSPYSIGDDFLANKANELASLLNRLNIHIHFEVWRHTKNEIVFYHKEKKWFMRLCEDNCTPNEAYLVDAWILFESLSDTDSDKFYQSLQDLAIFDDYNYDFSEGDYDE